MRPLQLTYGKSYIRKSQIEPQQVYRQMLKPSEDCPVEWDTSKFVCLMTYTFGISYPTISDIDWAFVPIDTFADKWVLVG